jgi:WD40 repeat protein
VQGKAEEPTLASASTDKTIRVWNLARREEAFKLEGAPVEVQALAYHPHGRRLVSLGQDRLIRLWDIVTKHEILEFEEHLGHLRAVAFSPDGRSLAAAGAGVVRVWQASREILAEKK